MVSLDSSIWTTYTDVCDFFIDDNHIGKECTLIYPPIRESCSNCLINPLGGGSTNIYLHGGPAPFSFGPCPVCGGNGYRDKEVTGTIRLRIYWRPRDWVKIGNINIPDASAQVIGYLSDLTKFRQASEIRLVNEQGYDDFTMMLAGEPALHGFGKNRYFIAYLRNV
jgi:hypothetical protein